MKIVVTGSLGYDYIMDFSGRFVDRIMPDKIHKLSLGFLVDTLSKQIGGTAGNIAYTLKLLGNEPLIASTGGNDFASYRTHLKKHNISTKFIKISKSTATGSYFVITDRDDNQIGSFYSGALRYNKEISLVPLVASNFVVIAPDDPQAMVKHVAECKDLKLRYMYDPAFQIDHFSAEELKAGIIDADILIGNDYEIGLIEKKIGMSHKELVDFSAIVITTLGSRGSLIEDKAGMFEVKAAKVNTLVDPTGAGDAYRAGFLTGFLKGFELDICGQMGSVAAAYTVEKYGTQTHEFTKKEFCKRYEENYNSKLILTSI